MLRVLSSRMERPTLEGFAKVEIKGPRDWKAAWRTWNRREQCREHSVRQVRPQAKQAAGPHAFHFRHVTSMQVYCSLK